MEPPVPGADAVRAELERILVSSGFERSHRLGRFLRYVVEESLSGRAEGLKEYTLGVEVFDRGDGFDPRQDPIVRVEARRLRVKLAAYYASEGVGDPVRIEVPTGGYEAIFRAAGEADSPSAPPPAPTFEKASEATRPVPRFASIGVVVLALGLTLGGVLWLSRDRSPEGAIPSSSDDRAEPVSVAVLPLTPIGDDPTLEGFSDGLTEDIITELARLRGLRVTARTSVARFKETEEPIRAIARDLGVSTVLEGSVRRERGLLRITAQLIDGRTEQHLWAETYDRTYANTLAIQGEVAREVSEALALRLSAEEKRGLLESRTTDPAAHEAYLRGVHHMSLRTPAEVQKGLEWLGRAVSLDPRYGQARVTLGEAYFFLALEDAGRPSELMEKTRELAESALAVDPDLAEGHRALGLVHAFRDRNWPAAEERFRRALELGPGMFPNHEAMATALLLPLGRIREAVEEQSEACALNPLSASALATLGRLVALAGDEAEGVRLLESAIDLEPRYARAYIQLAKLHLREERPEAAVPLLRKAAELAPDTTSPLGPLAVAYARIGRRDESEAIERELEKRSAAGRTSALSRAEVAMALGRFDEAITWLEEAVGAREPMVIFLGVDPLYAPLHAEPRFIALLRRLGLETQVF